MDTKTSIAQRLFDGSNAESELEEKLDEAGVKYEKLGFDYYDQSLELYDVPSDYRLSAEAQAIIHEAGFAMVYVNHLDKWETHYTFDSGEFKPKDGWRVSYPHKRSDGTAGILVEKPIPRWPQEWFDSGYAKVITNAKQE